MVVLTFQRRAKTEKRVESLEFQIHILILTYRRLDLSKILNLFES